MINGPVPHLETGLADFRDPLRIPIRHLAPDHALNNPGLRKLVDPFIQRLDRRPVAKDRDRVSDLLNFVQLMGNDDADYSDWKSVV